jgi:hypothetical protein
MSRNVSFAIGLACAMLAAAVVACASAYDAQDDSPDTDARAPDAPADVSPDSSADADAPLLVPCNPSAPFGSPSLVAGVSSPTAIDGLARLTGDELSLYFESARGVGVGLYVATRTKRSDPFGTPAPVAGIEAPAPARDFHPFISSDALVLLFASNRTGTADLFEARRASTSIGFGTPIIVGVSTSADERTPWLASGGAELWFASDRPRTDGGVSPGLHVWRAPRTSNGGTGDAVFVDLGSGSAADLAPLLSADGLTLYFASDRENDASATYDVWVARRSSAAAGFGPATPLTTVNTPQYDVPAWLSPDDCRLYLISNAKGSFDLYVAERGP